MRFPENELNMVTVRIKSGTPKGAESLCNTCRWAHIVKGFLESQETVRCKWVSEDPCVEFPVSQCNAYDDKRIPSLWDMQQIAWVLVTKSAGRSVGFVTAKRFKHIEGEDAEIVPAATLKTEPNE